jgi:hypothetical protein
VTRNRFSDALTAFAARSFPPSSGDEGRVVRDCARDAIDAGGARAIVPETLSVAGAGLRLRLRVSRRDLRLAPWRGALGVLVLPLAAALLCLWTFGFVPRYDHWPLGEGWALLLGGSLVAVIGAALRSRWLTAAGAAATFAAAAAPYLGAGTETAIADTPSFFQGWGVDLGAASLLPTLLLIAAAIALPRRPERSIRDVLDRLALGLLPTAVALIHLLPREKPQPQIGFAYDVPAHGRTIGGAGQQPTVIFGDPYPLPWLTESKLLITALGIALLVAAVYAWRTVRRHPEPALATGLVLASVAYPAAWVIQGYRVWPAILLPLAVGAALMLKGARAARL